MAVSLNAKGRANANSLIRAGTVDKTTAWSFSADDANAILGDPPDWKEYGRWFLGVDGSADAETKAHWKYPFGKNGKVYRSALTAIRQRASQQDEAEIFSAAGTMIDKIDAEEKSKEATIPTKEKRKVSEIRAIMASENNLKNIVGYAAVFDKPSEDMGFVEYVRKGAFRKAIANSDARALFNHDTDTLPLGRQSAGTLTLKEDDTGLYFEIDPPNTQAARDLMISIDRGDIKEASYGFTVAVDEWDWTDPKTPKRTIIEIGEIYDVSPVVFAAFPDTSVALRKIEEHNRTAVPSNGEDGQDDLSIGLGHLAAEEDELRLRMHATKEA